MPTSGHGLDAFPIPSAWRSDVDRAFASEIRAYVDKHILQRRQSEPPDGGLLADAWQGIAAGLGLQFAIFPERFGGAGQHEPSAAFILTAAAEQVGRGDVGLGMLLASTQALAASIVVAAPADHPRLAKLAETFVSDQATRGSLVMPSLAADAGAGQRDDAGRTVQASSRAEGERWAISAQRARPLCGGADAAWFGVVTMVEGQPALWWVPAKAEGVHRHQPLKQTGLWACPNAEISLASVRVDAGCRLISGTAAVRSVRSWFALLAAAACVGAGYAAFEILSEWGQSRVIKGRGRVFKDNPLAASVMADVAAGLHRSRILVYHLAYMIAHPDDHGPAGEDPVAVSA